MLWKFKLESRVAMHRVRTLYLSDLCAACFLAILYTCIHTSADTINNQIAPIWTCLHVVTTRLLTSRFLCLHDFCAVLTYCTQRCQAYMLGCIILHNLYAFFKSIFYTLGTSMRLFIDLWLLHSGAKMCLFYTACHGPSAYQNC